LYHVIVFAPLLSAIIAGFFGTRFGRQVLPEKAALVLTTGFLFISAILSWVALYKVGICHEEADIKVLRWMDVGNMKAEW
jgi:NADH-quinone oxidoreductase subunit L